MALEIGTGITFGGGITIVDDAWVPGGIYTNSSLSVSLTTATESPYGGAYESYVSSSTTSVVLTSSQGDPSWDLGTDDWTIEFWLRWTSYAGQSFGIMGTPGGTGGWSFGFNPVSGSLGVSLNTGQPIMSFGNVYGFQNTWRHIAVVRDNLLFRCYLDGTRNFNQTFGSNTAINDAGTTDWRVFNTAGNPTGVIGNITDLRLVKGLAVYTGDFTVPSSPLALTQSANPYGGSNTQTIPAGYTKILLQPPV